MSTYEKTQPNLTTDVATGANRSVRLTDGDDGLYAGVKYTTSDGTKRSGSVKTSDALTAPEQTDLDAILAKLEAAAVVADGFSAK